MTMIAAERRPRKSPPASSAACSALSSRWASGPPELSHRSTIDSQTAGDAAMLARATEVSPTRWPAASTQESPV
jgi:hypothetical protein